MLKTHQLYCYRSSKDHLYKSSEVMTRWPEISQFPGITFNSISQPSITSLMIFDMQTPNIIYASHVKYQPIVCTHCRYRSEKVPKIGEKTDHLLITSEIAFSQKSASRKKFLEFLLMAACKIAAKSYGSIPRSCSCTPLAYN